MVVVLCLSPLRGPEACIAAKDHQIEDGPVHMFWRQGFVCHHLEGHLVGDDVVFWGN